MSAGHLQPVLNIVRGRPVLAVFEINLRCNSECAYCDLPLNTGRYEMTRAQIKRIFTNLYGYGLRYVFVQGGEPTLRKDLIGILQDLHGIGFALVLISNGTRITESFVQRLQTMPVSLSISLDTLNRSRYKRIRGADQLGLVLSGIELLHDYPHPKYITCILSECNRDDVIDVVRFSRQRGFIPVIGAYHWETGRYGKADAALQYQRDTAINIFQEVLRSGLVPRGYFRNYIKDNISWVKGDDLRRCDAGRHSIAIDASGNVAPCLALRHAGNLLDSSLEDILSVLDQSAIRQCSDRSSCNMMCSRVVGSSLRQPLAALITPHSLRDLKR
ncbi:MAG: radical SAM protein [Gammaproteobacteria bacterium]